MNKKPRIHLKGSPCTQRQQLTRTSALDRVTCIKCLKTLPYRVYKKIGRKFLGGFRTRKDAVYYCKVNQSLPYPYEFSDEFEIRF